MSPVIQIFLLFSLPLLSHSSLRIFSPPELISRFANPDIEVSIAYFGEIPWGKTLIGSVFYSVPNDACSFITPLHYDNEPSPIVMADRGNCSYVKKAMHAQLIGAKMLIINDAFYEETKDQFLGDDGNGDLINIPVVMLRKLDGDNIKEFLLSSDEKIARSVSISLSFELKKAEKVDIKVWLSTSNIESYNFIEEFHQNYLKLKEDINFRPLYALWFCAYCKHNNFKIKNDNCLSGGRYCYPDPDIGGPLLGKDYVKESLRQICIYNSEQEKWWNYMKIFKLACMNSTGFENCTTEIMEKIVMNTTAVKECVQGSFSGPDEELDDNSILKADYEIFKNDGIQIWPSVLINNNLYKGILNGRLVFEIICRSFLTPPSVCLAEVEDLQQPKKETPDTKPSLKPVKIDKTNDYSLFLLIVGILAAFVIFFWIIKCRVFTKTTIPRDISMSINSAVSRYFAFQDKNDKEKMIEVSA